MCRPPQTSREITVNPKKRELNPSKDVKKEDPKKENHKTLTSETKSQNLKEMPNKERKNQKKSFMLSDESDSSEVDNNYNKINVTEKTKEESLNLLL